MWSESFQGEERAVRRRTPGETALSVAAGLVALCALGGEVVLSVQVTSDEFTSRAGSGVLGFISLLLGLVGPYAAILAWRADRNRARPPLRRGATTAVVAACAAGVAIAWLLLIRSSIHQLRVLF